MNLNRLAGIAALGVVLACPVAAQQQPAAAPAIAKTNLKVGDIAPDFTLPDNSFKPVKLSDFRGKKTVVLAFYVLAFTGG